MELRLGVNIDHIATLRQLRGTPYPDILTAAQFAVTGGADQITVHLREDRRHIQEADVRLLKQELQVPLNLEMAVSPAIVRFALKMRPAWACLVPEKRKELTTEGGLDVIKNKKAVATTISKLQAAGIRVSCFIEPHVKMIRASHELGADAVELHTGRYCRATQNGLGARSLQSTQLELERIKVAALLGKKLGLHVHAGHGFDYQNIRNVVELEDQGKSPLIEEYNIGHSIICRAALVGLERAVREMLSAIRAP